MAEWARTLGFEIVCAGRGTVLFADDHHATPEKYLDMAARNRMNPKTYTEFRDGTKPQLERSPSPTCCAPAQRLADTLPGTQ
jgi:predicted homoserine dehydrogenase-like protein